MEMQMGINLPEGGRKNISTTADVQLAWQYEQVFGNRHYAVALSVGMQELLEQRNNDGRTNKQRLESLQRSWAKLTRAALAKDINIEEVLKNE